MDIKTTERPGTRELVAFHIKQQAYCIDIMRVREIRSFASATSLPHSPDFIVGVINLRGTVLPIMDLSARLGFGTTKPTARSAVIVVEIGHRLIGLLVDGMSALISVADDLLQPTPEIASDMARAFVRGVLALDDGMTSMIEIDALMPKEQLVA